MLDIIWLLGLRFAIAFCTATTSEVRTVVGVGNLGARPRYGTPSHSNPPPLIPTTHGHGFYRLRPCQRCSNQWLDLGRRTAQGRTSHHKCPPHPSGQRTSTNSARTKGRSQATWGDCLLTCDSHTHSLETGVLRLKCALQVPSLVLASLFASPTTGGSASPKLQLRLDPPLVSCSISCNHPRQLGELPVPQHWS